MPVRTRIAPSPTGDPHVGTLYIALFNYAFAKRFQGEFLIRIEDTDQKRSDPIYEKEIFQALKWAGLNWDEGPDIGGQCGPYRQSERKAIYQKYAQKLLDEGKAYKCFATPEELKEMRQVASKLGKKQGYDRRYRNLTPDEVRQREAAGQSYVVRLKVPLSGECVFVDEIKGRITCPWIDVDDQVLLKSDGFPTYHLGVVVDDHLMGITHVIRGDEWLTSTPKHILLYEYLGLTPPVFMHLPLLLGKDGRKISKRRNPTSINYFRESGFLPEALVNFLSLMGYSMPNEKEIYSFQELIETFDPKRFGTSGAFFDLQKLEWLNQKYIINQLSEKQLLEKIKELYANDNFLSRIMPLAHTRIKTFGDFFDLGDFFFKNHLNYSDQLFPLNRIEKITAAYLVQSLLWSLENKKDFSAKAIEEGSHEIASLFGLDHKKIIMPVLFAALMGKNFGPSLFESAEILGKERVRARFLKTIEFLGGISEKKLKELQEGLTRKDLSFLKKTQGPEKALNDKKPA
ncbi:MAG: glutamate--tRNA ligase [Parachlamydiales bacterium]|jgi:glutamyl-tRNA synthetase